MTPQQEHDYREYVATQATRLCRFAFLCCGDWHRAEDAVQSAFIRLYGAWAKAQKSTVDAYMRRIIVNILIDESRLFRFRREQTTDRLPDRPHQRYERTEDRVVLIEALLKLPRRQRAAVVLRHWEDLPAEQTAQILGCSAGAARNLAMRGLATLRGLLAGTSLERVEGVTS